MRKNGDHAIVLGAGMGGLLAARVLADAYRRVTVVERDPLPEAAEHRRGVPHGRHAHVLVPGGARILDELFPGLVDDLAAGGAPMLRDFAEFRFSPGGHLLRLVGASAASTPYLGSRPFLEAHVRARVRALPAVGLVDRCDVVGLVTGAARDRVTGVRIHRRDVRGGRAGKAPDAAPDAAPVQVLDGTPDEVLDADLVLDATGRGSRAAAWLTTMGYDPPPEERLTVNLKYATRHLRRHPGALGGVKGVGVGAEPSRPTGMAMFAEEGDRWILTVFGYQGHHPPTDPDAFLAFVQSIAPPDVFAAIRDAEPLDDVLAYRFQANLRRRYERLRRFPSGLVVFGDAICSLNPAYGQGMSVAALQAVALRGVLAGGDRDLARRFFRAAAKPVGVAWGLTVGSELSLPQVQGPRPLPGRVIGAYVNRARAAAERDPVVAERLLRVASLQDPPPRLFRPSTMRRILLARRRRRRGPAPDAAPPAPSSVHTPDVVSSRQPAR